MTLQDLYTQIGGDYEGVLGRLMNSERMVQKFVLKFLADGSYELLLRSMEAQDYPEAFRAAHTIKGIGQNLGFTPLYELAGALSDALRNGFTPGAPALAEQLEAEYRHTAEAIRAFQTSLEA